MQVIFLVFLSFLVVLSWAIPNDTEPNSSSLNKKHKYGLGFLGIHPDPNYQIPVKRHIMKRRPIPEFFDARTNWPECRDIIGEIRNQGMSGSCWAFSSVEVMSDLCIQSGGKIKFHFSPEDLLSCYKDCGNCSHGGYLAKAWEFFTINGIVSGGDHNTLIGCQPYFTLPFVYGRTPECQMTCQNLNYNNVPYSDDKRYGYEFYILQQNVEQIQIEIMTNGPVIAGFNVYEDFQNHFKTKEVYVHRDTSFGGGHVVKIIG